MSAISDLRFHKKAPSKKLSLRLFVSAEAIMVEIRTIAVMGATGNYFDFTIIATTNAVLGRQGRGVVDALTFNKGDVEYRVRPLTRSLTSKLARRFAYDYPHLSLLQWKVEDILSLQQCFEGCYGAFIDSGVLLPSEVSLKEWTRAELALGERCRRAAEVNSNRIDIDENQIVE